MKSSRALTKIQRKYFNQLVNLIGDKLTAKDVYELENAAMCLQMIEEAEAGIKKHGTIQTFKNGTRQLSPEYSQWEKAATMWEKYVRQFGLSPKARADMGLEGAMQEKPADPLAALRVSSKKGKVKNG